MRQLRPISQQVRRLWCRLHCVRPLVEQSPRANFDIKIMKVLLPRLLPLIAALLTACAAVNPNNNVGLTTTDMLFQRGDCEGAKQIAEPHAQRGEPWAQYRMGMLGIDEKCPSPKPRDIKLAISWLQKAACYQAKSDWERGSPTSSGPSGYYNTRASSTNAARTMVDIYLNLHVYGVAWYYTNRAISLYEPNAPEYQQFLSVRQRIESQMTPAQIETARNSNICGDLGNR